VPRTREEIIAILTRPFESHQVQSKGRYAYISHGLITERLLEADPWYETRVTDVHKGPGPDGHQHCYGITLELCLHVPPEAENEHQWPIKICRTESGGPQRQESFALEIKNAQSDALKRAAMRFGVALGIWEDMIDSSQDEDYQRQPAPRHVVNGRTVGPKREENGKGVNDGATVDQVTAITRLSQQLNDPDWVTSLIGSKRVNTIAELRYRDAVAVIKALQERLKEGATTVTAG